MNDIKEGDIVKVVTNGRRDCKKGDIGRIIRCFYGLQNYYHILVNDYIYIYECDDEQIEKVGGLIV